MFCHEKCLYHQLGSTNLIQTVVENWVQDAKYLDSEVNKLSSSDLKIAQFIHASELADLSSFRIHTQWMYVADTFTHNGDWYVISASYGKYIVSIFRVEVDVKQGSGLKQVASKNLWTRNNVSSNQQPMHVAKQQYFITACVGC
jgi:hypothetical protein